MVYIFLIKGMSIDMDVDEFFLALVISTVITFIFYVISPVPIGDEIRYLGYSRFQLYHRIFTYSILGDPLIHFSDLLSIDAIYVYWIYVFIAIFLFFTITVNLVKLISKKFGLVNIDAKLVASLIIFGLNLNIVLLFMLWIQKPYEFNDFIFANGYHYWGRITYIDPQFLKNFAILIFLSYFIEGNLKRSITLDTSVILISDLNMATFIPIFLSSFILSLMLRDREMIKAHILAPLFLSYLIIYYGFSMEIFLTILTLYIVIIIIYLLFKFHERITDKRHIALVIFVITFIYSIYIFLNPKIPIELYLSRSVSFQALFFFIFYLFLIAYILEKWKPVSVEIQVSLLFYLLLPIIVFSAGFILEHHYVSFLKSGFLVTFYDRALRSLCLYYFYLPSLVVSLLIILRKNKLYMLQIILLFLLAILNILFFLSYWGFYYRNPWANGKLMDIPFNATITNQMFYSIAKLPKIQGNIVIACFWTGSVDFFDIYSMYTGEPGLNPLSVSSGVVPSNISNYFINIPDIFISCPNEPLKNISAYLYLNISNKYTIYVYYFNGSSNNFVIYDGPIASPILSPTYLNHLLIWKQRIPGKWIYNFDKVARDGSIARVSFIMINPERVSSCNLTLSFLQKYKYILVKNVKDPANQLILKSKNSDNVIALPYFLFPDFFIAKNDILIESDKFLPFVNQVGMGPYCINGDAVYGFNSYNLVLNYTYKP
jgi:hypothetical protein